MKYYNSLVSRVSNTPVLKTEILWKMVSKNSNVRHGFWRKRLRLNNKMVDTRYERHNGHENVNSRRN